MINSAQYMRILGCLYISNKGMSVYFAGLLTINFKTFWPFTMLKVRGKVLALQETVLKHSHGQPSGVIVRTQREHGNNLRTTPEPTYT
jgi:hypothetical protein